MNSCLQWVGPGNSVNSGWYAAAKETILQNGLAGVSGKSQGHTLKGDGEREDFTVKKRGENCPLAHYRKCEFKLWTESLPWRCALRLAEQSLTHPVTLRMPPRLCMHGLSTLLCCCIWTHSRFRRSVGSLPPLSCYVTSERTPWPTDFIFIFLLFPQGKVGQFLWFILIVIKVAYWHVVIHINSNSTSPIAQHLCNKYVLYMHIHFVDILSLCSTITPASEAVVQS